MQVCTETFGAAPDVIIHRADAADITMPYVDSHLDYMLFELMKNAMRAVVEASRRRGSRPGHGREAALPPLHVRICTAPTSVTLRISDQVDVCSAFLAVRSHLCPHAACLSWPASCGTWRGMCPLCHQRDAVRCCGSGLVPCWSRTICRRPDDEEARCCA